MNRENLRILGRRMLLVALLALIWSWWAPEAGATTTLTAGRVLTAGQRLVSPNGFVVLTVQADGNMVVYGGGAAVWTSHSAGRPGAFAAMQSDGNVVLYSFTHAVLWTARTAGTGAANRLVIGDSGNFSVINPAGRPIWKSGSRATRLKAGAILRPGQFLTSVSGELLVMQADGNLVIYRGGTALWSTRTSGHRMGFAHLQSDGNLVVRAANGATTWNSHTRGAGNHLDLGAGGRLTLSSSAGRLLWPSAARTASTAPQLAAALLHMWGGRLVGASGVQSDLLAASRGRMITNSDSCGRSVSIDIRLLRVLVALTGRYQLSINDIITGHGCDAALHPRGKAADIGRVTELATGRTSGFHPYRGGDNAALDNSFTASLAALLPAGSGIGQRGCPGRSMTGIPAGINTFADSCTHQHFQVPAR